MATDSPIAFVGTYPPRRCGIATFTRDLAKAVQQASDDRDASSMPTILAVTDSNGQYEYPAEVKYEIRQAMKSDYARAAEFINFTGVRLVSIQHEYGIFGGDDGVYILDLLVALRVPALVTLHTVLKNPSESQKNIVRKMSDYCVGFVVMSQTARNLLIHSYGIDAEKIHEIPHGIPDMKPCDSQIMKAKFGVAGQRMLLSFGLLGPNKGIETVIRALPAVVKAFPDVVYFVVGATHPMVVRQYGEAYRTTLEREAEALGVREQVVFRDQFVTIEELCNYLQATDIFVSAYLNEAQVTSGALSYAMGAGTAVISTPYWHAQELLEKEPACLFPFGDHQALSRILMQLFSSPSELDRLSASFFETTRSFIWPRIGQAYRQLADKFMGPDSSNQRFIERRKPGRISSVPELRLDHLVRLTDDTGIIQHATFSVPCRKTGYCVDDNARALIVALQADRLNSSPQTKQLIITYLSYLQYAQTEDGSFRNMMNYDRTMESSQGSEDCIGRAIWALGTCVRLTTDNGCRRLAKEMFEYALVPAINFGPRGTALTMLGLVNFLGNEPDHAATRNTLSSLADKLTQRFQESATEEWRWFESPLTYDNAIIPLALFRAYGVTGERTSLRVAREALEFLEELCFKEGKLILIGNSGWYSLGGSKPETDEQAIDAAAFVLAFRGAYQVTGDQHYLRRMREAFAWFLGANRLGLPLYNFATAGCHDGLGAEEPNRNEGAESTISFLLSLQSMLELAEEGVKQI